MSIQFEYPIPTVDWTKVSACCEGGRCGAPVQKPATPEQVEVSPQAVRQLEPQSPQPPTIEECEEVAARLVKAQRDWNNLRKKPHDLVKQPAHYTFASIEPLVAINAWQLSYGLGNVVKYIVRARHKGTELLDLEKAREYLTREIEFVTARLNSDEPVKVSER